jgi:glycosyltransferase involved in cell wall biosynthesis
MTSSPRVDVLIPAFNAAATIENAVASVQAQTVRDIRIIIVDDGSTDATPDIVRSLAAADPRVLLVSRANGGVVAAANTGLAHCAAPFFARLDADDRAAPDRLERQLAYLEANPDCVAVGGSVRHIDKAGRLVGTIGKAVPIDAADPYEVPAREPHLIHPTLTARLDAVRRAGGYRPVGYAEDSDLYWRLQEVGRLHNMPEILGDYRLHDQSISGKSVHNGRVLSVCSQMVALSARRRQEKRVDILFDDGLLGRLKGAAQIEDMIAVVAPLLEPREVVELRTLVAAKMLEFAGYRPWRLEASDCRFVRAEAGAFRHLPGEQHARLTRQLSGVAARLTFEGAARDAQLMLPLRYYPWGAARLVFRAMRASVAAMRGRELAERMG